MDLSCFLSGADGEVGQMGSGGSRGSGGREKGITHVQGDVFKCEKEILKRKKRQKKIVLYGCARMDPYVDGVGVWMVWMYGCMDVREFIDLRENKFRREGKKVKNFKSL